MEITWYGLSCFRITERGFATVVTDPFDSKLGPTLPKLRADIVTVSHEATGHNYLDAVTGYSYALTGPGEYEIGGVFVTGIDTRQSSGKRNILYLIDVGGLTVIHLGDISRVPTQSEIEALEMVNVVLVPVGGGNSLNAGQAAELVSMLEPNYVIPMHYQIPGLSFPLDSVDRFTKEMGVTEVKEDSSLKITSSNLPEETEVVLLQPKL